MVHSSRQAIAEELDAVGKRAFRFFEQKDVAGFMSMYSPDLEYTQLNGVTIDWRKLANDVRKQLKAITSLKTSTFREVQEVSGDEVVETSTQEAVIAVRVIWRITKKWNLLRRSKVWWIRTDEGWKVKKVVVLEESVI